MYDIKFILHFWLRITKDFDYLLKSIKYRQLFINTFYIMNIKELYKTTLRKLNESFQTHKNDIELNYIDSKKKIKENYQKAKKQQKIRSSLEKKKILDDTKNTFQAEVLFFIRVLFIILIIWVIFDFIVQKLSFLEFIIFVWKDIGIFFLGSSFLFQLLTILTVLSILYLIFISFLYRFCFTICRTSIVRIFNVIFILGLLLTILFFDISILLIIWVIFFVFTCFALQIYLDEQTKNNNPKKEWFLLSDKAIEKKEDDKLWMFKRAESFFKILQNNGSHENQVFWLVAEWGAGKSSFLNFLKWPEIHYMENNEENDENEENIDNYESMIFVDFKPWYYEGQKELLEKLLEEIIAALKNNRYYTGDISRKFSKFAQSLEDNSQNFFWMKIPFSSIFFWESSLQEHKNKINNFLSQIDKKLVIIIDDLDRVTSDKFIEVLKIVDLTRDFYKTSFVLCYDPQNFNSIDTTIIQTKGSSSDWIQHIDSQIVDNSELTRYMGKIITTYFPLEMNLEDIKREFINIFTENRDKIFFSKESKEWINLWIEKLFEYWTYSKWWKYYSDLRSIKRICNNFIVTIYSIDWKNNSKENLFNLVKSLFDVSDNSKWIYFDIFIKILVLKLFHNILFKKISMEVNIINKFGYKYDDYIISLWYSPKNDNKEYENFLISLTDEEKNLFRDLIPPYSEKLNVFNDELKRKGDIRNYWELWRYILFVNTAWDASKMRNIINISRKVLKWDFSLFKKFIENNDITLVNELLSQFPIELNNLQDTKSKKDLATKIIDELIWTEELYKFYEIDFTFYFDIAQILNASVRSNEESDVHHISEFVYWNENETALPIKIFENGKSFWEKEVWEEAKVKWLQEWLRLLLATDTTRWWSFYNFERAVTTEKLYEIIYPYFEKNYINAEKNFIEYIYEFEVRYNKKILGHLLYMLLNYAPVELRKSLTLYFIKGFEIDQEYFLKWIIRYVDEYIAYDWKNIMLWDAIQYFDKKEFEAYLKKNFEDFKKWLQKNSDKEITISSRDKNHSEMPFSYLQILKMYEKAYNWYFKIENK